MAVISLSITLAHPYFTRESLDNAQASERFLCHTQDAPPERLHGQAITLEHTPHTPHNKACYRQENEDKERELPANENHATQVDDNHDWVLQHKVKATHNRVLHFGHVARYTGQHIALTLTREIA